MMINQIRSWTIQRARQKCKWRFFGLIALILSLKMTTPLPLLAEVAPIPTFPFERNPNEWNGQMDQYQFLVNNTVCQPWNMLIDRIQPIYWYITCMPINSPILIRYDLSSSATLVLIPAAQADLSIVSMKQDDFGRLFFVWADNSDVKYLEAPFLPSPNTTLITILDSTTSFLRGVDVIAYNNIAWISVEAPPPAPADANLTPIPAVLRYNLTSSSYTNGLSLDICQSASVLSLDWVNEAVLVTCADGIWAIPLKTTDSPYLVLAHFPESQFINHIRGRDCLFVCLVDATGQQMSVLAVYNQTSYESVYQFSAKSCVGLGRWVYDPLHDSLWIACSVSSAPSSSSVQGISTSSNVLSLQTSVDGIVGGQQTLISNVCNNAVTPSFGVNGMQLDPFGNGFFVACNQNVYHVYGRAVTTLVGSSTCTVANQIRSDSVTGLAIVTCDRQLLVLDGGLQYAMNLVGDCGQFTTISSLTLGENGVSYIVGFSYVVVGYEVCRVEAITPESVLVSNTVQTTSLGLFATLPILYGDDDGMVFLLQFVDGDGVLSFLNSSLEWQSLPGYCALSITSFCTMNGFLFVGCISEGIITLPLTNLTDAIPTTIWNATATNLTRCASNFAITPKSTTNELWISCNLMETLLVINGTDGSIHTFTLEPAGLPFFPLVDETSSLVFLYDTRKQLQIYDTVTNILMFAPLTSGSCDSVTTMDLNRLTGVVYASCQNGNAISFSKDFTCQSGYQWQRDGCQPCTVGHARGLAAGDAWATRIPQCQQCSPGSIAMQPGSSVCTPCPIGRYQDFSMQQQQVCLFCQPGTAQNLTGQTSCLSCPAGQFATNVGLAECDLCPPGRYSTSNTSAVCQLCDRGSASQVWGLNTTCPLCQPGTEQLQYGGLTCSACPLGSFAPQGDPCSTCPLHSYQATIGRPCVPCDGAGQDGLYCEGGLASVKEGWFAYQSYDQNLNQWIYLTTECPDTFCPGSPLQVSNSSSVNGTDASIEYCLYPRLNSPQNLLCAECADDYIVWGQDCVECNEAKPLALVLIIIFLFILVGFLLRSSTESAGHLNILLFFIQTAALELRARQTTETTNWIQIFNLGFLSFNTCVGPMNPLQQILLMYLSPFILLIILILIGCLHRLLQPHRLLPQLIHKFSLNKYIACIMTILLFCYTNVTVSVVQTFNCVEVTPGVTVLWSQPTVDCSSDDYHQLLILSIVWLVVYVLGFPLAIFFFLLHRHLKRGASISSSGLPIGLDANSHRFTSESDGLTHHSLGVNDGLKKDLGEPLHQSLSLTEDRTVPSMALSSTSLIHSSMSERAFILPGTESDLRWGGLFLSFTHTAWYWQSWILVRRLIFALISVLLYQSPNLSFILFTAVNIVCLFIHQATEPFTLHVLNRIDTCAYTLLIAVSLILAGTSNSSVVLEVILFMLIVVPSFFFLLYTLRYRLKQLHYKRQERRLRTAALMNVSRPPMMVDDSDHELADGGDGDDEEFKETVRSYSNESI